MQKAADDMRKQQEQAAEEKAKAIEERVPKLELAGLDQSQFCYHFIGVAQFVEMAGNDECNAWEEFISGAGGRLSPP